jgi:hypothetical protein
MVVRDCGMADKVFIYLLIEDPVILTLTLQQSKVSRHDIAIWHVKENLVLF